MKQRELFWASLPFSDLSETKIRPCIIVSNNSYNEKAEDVVVCAVTSSMKQADYSVSIAPQDLEAGKLPIPSRVKADKIFRLHKKLLLKPFGKLRDKNFAEVVKEINNLLKAD